MIKFAVAAVAIVIAVPAASAVSPGQPQEAWHLLQADSRPICKYVLAADPKADPYQLCQTKAQWAAMEEAYAKDANRMVCHYEETPGTRIGAHKICGPLNAWEARRAEYREMTEKIQAQTAPPH